MASMQHRTKWTFWDYIKAIGGIILYVFAITIFHAGFSRFYYVLYTERIIVFAVITAFIYVGILNQIQNRDTKIVFTMWYLLFILIIIFIFNNFFAGDMFPNPLG